MRRQKTAPNRKFDTYVAICLIVAPLIAHTTHTHTVYIHLITNHHIRTQLFLISLCAGGKKNNKTTSIKIKTTTTIYSHTVKEISKASKSPKFAKQCRTQSPSAIHIVHTSISYHLYSFPSPKTIPYTRYAWICLCIFGQHSSIYMNHNKSLSPIRRWKVKITIATKTALFVGWDGG